MKTRQRNRYLRSDECRLDSNDGDVTGRHRLNRLRRRGHVALDAHRVHREHARTKPCAGHTNPPKPRVAAGTCEREDLHRCHLPRLVTSKVVRAFNPALAGYLPTADRGNLFFENPVGAGHRLTVSSTRRSRRLRDGVTAADSPPHRAVLLETERCFWSTTPSVSAPRPAPRLWTEADPRPAQQSAHKVTAPGTSRCVLWAGAEGRCRTLTAHSSWVLHKLRSGPPHTSPRQYVPSWARWSCDRPALTTRSRPRRLAPDPLDVSNVPQAHASARLTHTGHSTRTRPRSRHQGSGNLLTTSLTRPHIANTPRPRAGTPQAQAGHSTQGPDRKHRQAAAEPSRQLAWGHTLANLATQASRIRHRPRWVSLQTARPRLRRLPPHNSIAAPLTTPSPPPSRLRRRRRQELHSRASPGARHQLLTTKSPERSSGPRGFFCHELSACLRTSASTSAPNRSSFVAPMPEIATSSLSSLGLASAIAINVASVNTT